MSDDGGIGCWAFFGAVILITSLAESAPGNRVKLEVDVATENVQELPSVRLIDTDYNHKLAYRLQNYGGRTRHHVYLFETPLHDTIYLLHKHDFRLRTNYKEHRPTSQETGAVYNLKYYPVKKNAQSIDGVFVDMEEVIRNE